MLNIFRMSRVRKTVSRALLLSIVTRSVLCAVLRISRPSCMFCVSFVRSVVVECKTLKRCCVGNKGMCGVTVLRIRVSRILMG